MKSFARFMDHYAMSFTLITAFLCVFAGHVVAFWQQKPGPIFVAWTLAVLLYGAGWVYDVFSARLVFACRMALKAWRSFNTPYAYDFEHIPEVVRERKERHRVRKALAETSRRPNETSLRLVTTRRRTG